MKVFYKKKSLKNRLEAIRKKHLKIGLVPTMGALHSGHYSLIERAIIESKVVVVTIFVNPTQFNDREDFKKYPHDIEKDLMELRSLLRKEDMVFIPDNKEMYPEPDLLVFDFGHLDKIMEGSHRPGHFNGVAQIVSKFFNIIKPDLAYFGEKDLQQLVIIRKLVEITNMRVQIIGCPIIREPDGLAMSSRNQLLSGEERKEAVKVYQALSQAFNLADKIPVETLKKNTIGFINNSSILSVEYFEIVDGENLLPIKKWIKNKQVFGCIAVKAGNVRLIDNIGLMNKQYT